MGSMLKAVPVLFSTCIWQIKKIVEGYKPSVSIILWTVAGEVILLLNAFFIIRVIVF